MGCLSTLSTPWVYAIVVGMLPQENFWCNCDTVFVKKSCVCINVHNSARAETPFFGLQVSLKKLECFRRSATCILSWKLCLGNVNYVLDLLHQHIPATYFLILVWCTEQCPTLVRQLPGLPHLLLQPWTYNSENTSPGESKLK